MADAKVVFEGWDSSTQGWGLGGWGQDVDIASATSSVGTVTVGAVTLVNVTGLQVDATAGNTTESAGGGKSRLGVGLGSSVCWAGARVLGVVAVWGGGANAAWRWLICWVVRRAACPVVVGSTYSVRGRPVVGAALAGRRAQVWRATTGMGHVCHVCRWSHRVSPGALVCVIAFGWGAAAGSCPSICLSHIHVVGPSGESAKYILVYCRRSDYIGPDTLIALGRWIAC